MNLNQKMTIYPNKRGFEFIETLLNSRHDTALSRSEVKDLIEKRTTNEFGYSDTMHSLISDLAPMFNVAYNDCFLNTNFKIEDQ